MFTHPNSFIFRVLFFSIKLASVPFLFLFLDMKNIKLNEYSKNITSKNETSIKLMTKNCTIWNCTTTIWLYMNYMTSTTIFFGMGKIIHIITNYSLNVNDNATMIMKVSTFVYCLNAYNIFINLFRKILFLGKLRYDMLKMGWQI